jgi:DHA2 family multidrug resistance protein
MISIYVLALGITTPVSGFLADRFGLKRVYLLGLAIFVIGSFLCGIAPSLGLLIAFRALQGFGGGLSQPLGAALLYRAFPPKEQGMAFGIFGLALVVAPALGPILGGWLVDIQLWRSIFFINVPIGIVGVLLGTRVLPNVPAMRRPVFDPLGLITATIGFGAVLYAATTAEIGGWTSPATLITLGIGLVALTAWVIVELYVAEEPMLNLRLFTNTTYLNATLVGYVATVALFGAEFLMPIYLQSFRGRTALEAGFILLGVAGTSAIATPLAGWLYDRIGPRTIVVVGFAVLCLNTWQLSLIQATTPIGEIVFLLALRGLAVGLTLQSTFITALGAVPVDVLPRASSLSNSTRFVVQAVSVAALAVILTSSLSAEVKAQQDQAQQSLPISTARFGACETPGVRPEDNLPPGTSVSLATLSPQAAAAARAKILAGLQRACDESMKGFQDSYRLTFYASIGALLLAVLLPGWPGKWGGRGSIQPPVAGGH